MSNLPVTLEHKVSMLPYYPVNVSRLINVIFVDTLKNPETHPNLGTLKTAISY